MRTPFFPVWRARLAPLGRRVQHLRQQSLPHLDLRFGPLLPTWLLSQTDAGPNRREQIYSVRRTCFGFPSQGLNPVCPCAQVSLHPHPPSPPLAPPRLTKAPAPTRSRGNRNPGAVFRS